jgi:hypothetical protein
VLVDLSIQRNGQHVLVTTMNPFPVWVRQHA